VSAIAKTYLISLLEWKAKRLVKSIISPLDDDEKPPERPSDNVNVEHKNSIPEIDDDVKHIENQSQGIPTFTPTSTPPPTPKVPQYQNPPPRNNTEPEDWATAIIKIACILVIGVVILNSVVMTASINDSSPFASVFTTITANIQSGYTLAALMVLALGAGAIMRFLGFM
jgi:hypothetical protein